MFEARAWMIATSLLAVASCNEATTSNGPSEGRSSAAAAPSSPSAAASATGTASATPPPSDVAQEGEWVGEYQSEKATLEMPPKVTNKERERDDGKQAVGDGEVMLRISGAHDISGSSKGPLGDAVISGKLDGEMVRASFHPVDPTKPLAMTGVFIGVLRDGKMQGEIKVAGPDGLVVRTASFQLKRK